MAFHAAGSVSAQLRAMDADVGNGDASSAAARELGECGVGLLVAFSATPETESSTIESSHKKPQVNPSKEGNEGFHWRQHNGAGCYVPVGPVISLGSLIAQKHISNTPERIGYAPICLSWEKSQGSTRISEEQRHFTGGDGRPTTATDEVEARNAASRALPALLLDFKVFVVAVADKDEIRKCATSVTEYPDRHEIPATVELAVTNNSSTQQQLSAPDNKRTLRISLPSISVPSHSPTNSGEISPYHDVVVHLQWRDVASACGHLHRLAPTTSQIAGVKGGAHLAQLSEMHGSVRMQVSVQLANIPHFPVDPLSPELPSNSSSSLALPLPPVDPTAQRTPPPQSCIPLVISNASEKTGRVSSYGDTPLAEVYDRLRQLSPMMGGRRCPKRSKYVISLLSGTSPGSFFGDELTSVLHSPSSLQRCIGLQWERLYCVDLRGTVLGDVGMFPLIIALTFCVGVEELYADENDLSGRMVGRLCSIFERRHKEENDQKHITFGLRKLSLNGNTSLMENGGESVLRLVESLHTLSYCAVQRCGLSESLERRIQAKVRANAMQSRSNQVCSAGSSTIKEKLLETLRSVPVNEACDALTLWSTVSTVPTTLRGFAEVCIPTGEEDAHLAPETFSPLLRQTLEHTYDTFCRKASEDPAIQMCFCPPHLIHPHTGESDAPFTHLVIHFFHALKGLCFAQLPGNEHSKPSPKEQEDRTNDSFPASTERHVGTMIEIARSAAYFAGVRPAHVDYALKTFVDALVERCGPGDVVTAQVRHSIEAVAASLTECFRLAVLQN